MLLKDGLEVIVTPTYNSAGFVEMIKSCTEGVLHTCIYALSDLELSSQVSGIILLNIIQYDQGIIIMNRNGNFCKGT